MSPCSRVDAGIRWTTTASVSLLAVIAAVVSYRHIHELALRQGESKLGAALVPLAVAPWGCVPRSNTRCSTQIRSWHDGQPSRLHGTEAHQTQGTSERDSREPIVR